jgi:hypothetical protein
MKTTKKTDKKPSVQKKKITGVKKKAKSADEVKSANDRLRPSFIDENEDEFDVPLDELENFDTFNEYDEEEDY